MEAVILSGAEPVIRGAAEATRARRSLDAVEFLEADHRRIERLFNQFERCRTRRGKIDLAEKICAALAMHSLLEEEMFHPAFVAATGLVGVHRQAEMEHQTCTSLLAQIDESDPSDPHLEARIRVLRDAVRSHIREEEKSDGMFAHSRMSGMELDLLGKKLRTRKYLIERGCLPTRSRSDVVRGFVTSSPKPVRLASVASGNAGVHITQENRT